MNTTTAPVIPDLVNLPPGPLLRSNLNPRRHFDDQYLNELTGSVKLHGVMENLITRPQFCVGTTTREQLDAKLADFMKSGLTVEQAPQSLVSGECRQRAAVAAKVATVPVRIKLLTDPEMILINLTEQLQRKQLTPMEEARSFAQLLTYKDGRGLPLHTTATIASQVGLKSESSVSGRLKLLGLSDTGAKALDDGRIGLKVAEAIARVPDPKAREEATKTILKGRGGKPLTKDEALEYISANFMRELKGAGFNQEDPTLCAKEFLTAGCTGKCSDCPMRTGNNRELFGDVKRTDICTRPACFAAKEDAAWKRATEKLAKDEGAKVLTIAESRQIFPDHFPAGEMMPHSALVDVDAKPEDYLVKRVVGNLPTWRELLARVGKKLGGTKDGIKPQLLAVTDQALRVHLMVDRGPVIAAAEKAGEPIFVAKQEPALKKANDNFRERQREEDREKKVQSRLGLVALGALHAALLERLTPKLHPLLLWQALGSATFENLSGEGAEYLCKWQAIENRGEDSWLGKVSKWIEKMTDAQRMAIVPLVALAPKMRWLGVKAPGVAELADWLKVDLKALEKQVRAETTKKPKVKEKTKDKGPKAAEPKGGSGKQVSSLASAQLAIVGKAAAKPNAKKRDAGSRALAAVKASMSSKGKKAGA